MVINNHILVDTNKVIIYNKDTIEEDDKEDARIIHIAEVAEVVVVDNLPTEAADTIKDDMVIIILDAADTMTHNNKMINIKWIKLLPHRR